MGIFLMIVGSLAVWLTIGVLSAKLVFILRKRQLTRIRDLSGYNVHYVALWAFGLGPLFWLGFFLFEINAIWVRKLFRWVMKDAPV